MTRLAVARLWYCSNGFNPRRTRLADLQRHEWTVGPAALSHPRPPRSEIDGLSDFLAVHPAWDITMLRCAAAPPGGPLAAEALGTWLTEVEEALRSGRFDALYVTLHGACQAEGDPSADITVLRRLRLAAGRMPIVATFNTAANLGDEASLLLDGTTAIRAPGDAAAAAVRALAMLEGILTGRIRPVGAVARVPALLTPGQLARVLQEIWREDLAPRRSPVLDASVFSGFPWADGPNAGPSAIAWADRDAGAAREAAAALALRLARGRDRTAATMLPAAEAMARAAAQGRALVLDVADDPACGGLGDTPGLLRAMLDRPGPAAALGVLADPRAVAAAHQAGQGATLTLALGAGITPIYGAPVNAAFQVRRLLPGAAVLQAGQVAILVAERPAIADPALFALAGIDLNEIAVLAVKGGEAARSGFTAEFPMALIAVCPGPASPDLSGLPFNYVPAARRSADAAERFAADQQRAIERLEDHRRSAQSAPAHKKAAVCQA